jgi:filamentous hemagglutinin family protein
LGIFFDVFTVCAPYVAEQMVFYLEVQYGKKVMIPRHCQKLAVAIFTTVIFYGNSLNAQIVPDATLRNNSSVETQDNIKIIQGGTQAGSNLFHSLEQFSVPTNTTAYFNNNTNIQNIITRITGKSISNIDGTIRANGIANLFLINPSGILFGDNAALDIGGSFLATTASSINFADGTLFSATQPQTKPLLTVSVPIGLQFGATAAPIRNQSQASQNDGNSIRNPAVGLQVATGKTLALIGGDVILVGGNLSVDSGRIELAAVGNNSFVSLNSIDSWALGYEGVENFRNIQLTQRSVDGSEISSYINVFNQVDSGNIQIRGYLIELIGNNAVNLINNIDRDVVDSGSLNITAEKLVIRDGTQINSFALGKSAAANLTVNAFDSLEIIGAFDNGNAIFFKSALSSNTAAIGKAGNILINTRRLLVKDGAAISADSSGISQNAQLLTATGEAGNLTINATESVELIGSFAGSPSRLRATTLGSANAGNLTINTKQLVVRDRSEITVSNQLPKIPANVIFDGNINDLGNAGELNITADSILLDNQGKLTSQTQSANGGNINLQLKDLLLIRRNSQISTNAGIAQLEGNGGNININIPNGFIVAVPDENSDITANAFTGSGGRVDINATGIFGIQPRSRDELTELLATDNPSELNPQELLTSDITAISQQNPNLNGILSINATDVEPTKEVVELPEIPVDTKVSQVCRFRRGNQSEFVYTRRGGLPALPSQALRGDSALSTGWVEGETRRQGDKKTRGRVLIKNPIVEATGWVKDKNGDIFFVAEQPNQNMINFEGVSC